MTKLKKRAEVICWPHINSDVDEIMSKCGTCLKYRDTQGERNMTPHEQPAILEGKVGMDLFALERHDHLIIMDYFNHFPD